MKSTKNLKSVLGRRWAMSMAIASSLAMVGVAEASPVAYYLSPFGSASTVLNGNPYNITATFSFDASTELESSVNIILGGSSPFSGTYVDDPIIVAEVHSSLAGDNRDVCGYNGSTVLCLRFFDPLGGTADDILHIVATGTNEADIDLPATGFDGAAVGVAIAGSPPTVSATGVPEPLTLSLFGAGLAGAVAMRRRKKA